MNGLEIMILILDVHHSRGWGTLVNGLIELWNLEFCDKNVELGEFEFGYRAILQNTEKLIRS